MPEDATSCKLGEKTVCPRCSHEFVPDENLLEESRIESEKGGSGELDAIVACPICGSKLKLKL